MEHARAGLHTYQAAVQGADMDIAVASELAGTGQVVGRYLSGCKSIGLPPGNTE